MNNQQLLTLKEAAKNYHNLGLPIIPFILSWNEEKQQYEKTNIGTWKRWQTEAQTDEDFNNLRWNKEGKEANAFGVLLGKKAKNGLYLTVVDYDVKGAVSEEAKKIGLKIVSELPITRVEETINKGLHYLYWSKTRVETDGTFHDKAGLELLGDSICLVAPSYGYNNIGSDVITEVENTAKIFWKKLSEHNLLTQKKQQETTTQEKSPYNFNLSDIIDLTGFTQLGPNEYQGKHPVHDSTTEKNFCVNTKDNSWHCFRHHTGGGPFQFLAVKEGILDCEEAGKGALKGKKYRETLKLAIAQGLIDTKALEQSEIHPIILAKDIMEDYKFATDKESDDLYYWIAEDGIYCNKTKQLIKREMVLRLDENFKDYYYTDVSEFIKNSAPLVEMDKNNPEILAVKNGLLNVLTRELTPINSEIYITSKIDWEYNKDVKATNFLKFLEQVLPNDIKSQKRIQQLLGHCLYKKIITETSLILYGKGENGKSILLDTLKMFLGSKNLCGHSIQQLCYDKFVLKELRGKLANICADLPHKEIASTGTYKGLVSGDSEISVYTKHKQETENLTPFTKFIFSANSIPPVTDEEDAYSWYRRFAFVDFKQVFSGKKKVPRQTLLSKMSTPDEMTGILNWALNGLEELHKNGDITDKPSVEEIRKEYRKRSSSVLEYFDTRVKITDNEKDFVFTDEWFRDYVTFCHISGLTPVVKNVFLEKIEKDLPGAHRTKKRPIIEGEKKPNPISAWKFVKICSTCSTSSTFSDNKGPSPKITDFPKNNIEGEKPKKSGTDGTDGTTLDIVTEPQFLRYVEYERIPRKPGVYCSSIGKGEGCTFEAEWNLNGNLFCDTHFREQAKYLQENGTGLKPKGEAF